ncbi:MAG: glycosyltransferase [Rhodospirillales bacterium]|nr:glycosyltransferase [Rhodospirillales bacterium]
MMGRLKQVLRPVVRGGMACAGLAATRTGMRRRDPAPVHFVIEKQDWATRRVGTGVRDGVERHHPGKVALVLNAVGAERKVVHYGSQYMWEAWQRFLPSSNRYVTSFFHGKPEDGPDIARHIDRFLASVPRLSRVVASNSLLMDRLSGWGVPADKLVRIPIGTDTALFQPPTPDRRRAARQRWGVPADAVAIGSFQKDGIGWGAGMEPKLIKGPDILVEAVAAMAKQCKVHVILTGPARGYVKAGLARRDIPFTHDYLADYAELTSAYHALDIYLMTSREEGGPMALMESMASHVPVVSTPVGMAPDLIDDGETGWLTPIDATAIAAVALGALDRPEPQRVLAAARERVLGCDWKVVADSHWKQVYRPLMDELGL